MRWGSATGAVERFCAAVMLALRTMPDADDVRTDRPEGPRSDRGDVPGWVMITVMTAVVVLVLVGVFQDAVVGAVQNAFKQIGGMFD